MNAHGNTIATHRSPYNMATIFFLTIQEIKTVKRYLLYS